MRCTLFVLCLSVLLCALALPSTALVASQTVKLNKMLTRVDSFAFRAGGTFKISTTLSPEPTPNAVVKVYLCTEREYSILVGDAYSLETECLSPAQTLRCTGSAQVNRTIGEVVFPISDTNRYRFALVRCGSDMSGITAHVKYEAVNPGNDQLPYGDGRFPRIYYGLCVAWALLGMLTIYRTFFSDARPNMLHYGLLLVVALKLVVVLVQSVYWNTYRSGHRVDALLYARRIVFAASETALFGLMLVCSKGWRITRISMRTAELKTLFTVLTLLLAALVCFSFYSDDYYFLSLMIMYFFMLPKIFASVTKNVRSLETQIWMAQNVQLPDVNTSAFSRKLTMFRVLRAAVVTYLATILLVNSLRIVLIWYLDWINVAINEVVVLLVVAVLAHFLRPGTQGVFTDMAEITHLAILQALIERSQDMAANPDAAPAIVPWDMTKTLVIEYPSKLSPPFVDAHAAHKKQVSSIEEDNEQKEDPSAHNIALALLQEYDAHETFEASVQRP